MNLAPGDRVDPTLLARVSVRETDFDLVYDRLWAEFGPRGEMEAREVLIPDLVGRQEGDWFVQYHPLCVRVDEDVAAVRDCMVAVGPITVILLSHVWVDPIWRRTGVAAICRAAPLTFAPEDRPCVLIAEMEPLDDEPSRVRFSAYLKAGFTILPIPYVQPDFSRGGTPIPLVPVLRCVGVELSPALLDTVYDGLDAIHAPHDPADLKLRRDALHRWLRTHTIEPATLDSPEILPGPTRARVSPGG